MSPHKMSSVALAAAAAVLFSTAAITTASAADTGTVKCAGVNACKGQSACKSANNACKGMNSHFSCSAMVNALLLSLRHRTTNGSATATRDRTRVAWAPIRRPR